MSEKKPAEFSVQAQDVSDVQMETVAGGTTVPHLMKYFQNQKDSSPDGSIIPPEDILISTIVARTSF